MSPSTHHIAIIGAGPSGCYVADALCRKLPAARIDVFDQWPTPFGLVRGGVAPDHQGTKNIARQFERTLAKNTVRFLGNVAIGRDLHYEELKAAYDLIVITIGALDDRPLGIPGDELDGVYGSGAFVAWYNGIPSARDLAPRLDGASVAIIGNGNVALDIARLLGKTGDELATSDLCAHARDAFAAAPLRDIWLIGRRGPLEASFTTAELAEFGELCRVTPLVDASQLPDSVPDSLPEDQRKLAEKNLEILHQYAAQEPQPERPIRLHFVFNAAPVQINGSGRVSELVLEKTRIDHGRAVLSGERFTIAADTLIAAIGYRSTPFAGLPFDQQRGIIAHDQGRVETGVYTAGWCKRGPQGVVPANRADALAVADLMLADPILAAPSEKPGSDLIDGLLRERCVRVVDYAAWQKINAAEVAAGSTNGSVRPREKLTRLEDLLAAAGV